MPIIGFEVLKKDRTFLAELLGNPSLTLAKYSIPVSEQDVKGLEQICAKTIESFQAMLEMKMNMTLGDLGCDCACNE